MFSRSVPERINGFLLERRGQPYCDSCIQEWLGLKWRQQVQLITATLSVTAAFRRDRGFCCNCNDHKRVIAALAVSPEAEKSPARTAATAASAGAAKDERRIFRTPMRLPVTTSTAR